MIKYNLNLSASYFFFLEISLHAPRCSFTYNFCWILATSRHYVSQGAWFSTSQLPLWTQLKKKVKLLILEQNGPSCKCRPLFFENHQLLLAQVSVLPQPRRHVSTPLVTLVIHPTAADGSFIRLARRLRRLIGKYEGKNRRERKHIKLSAITRQLEKSILHFWHVTPLLHVAGWTGVINAMS